jgi:hypothetical protein
LPSRRLSFGYGFGFGYGYASACRLLLDNQTSFTLRLSANHMESGGWLGNGKPPSRIRPNELIMCGCVSRGVGGFGDCEEGQLEYTVDNGGSINHTCLHFQWGTAERSCIFNRKIMFGNPRGVRPHGAPL